MRYETRDTSFTEVLMTLLAAALGKKDKAEIKKIKIDYIDFENIYLMLAAFILVAIGKAISSETLIFGIYVATLIFLFMSLFIFSFAVLRFGPPVMLGMTILLSIMLILDTFFLVIISTAIIAYVAIFIVNIVILIRTNSIMFAIKIPDTDQDLRESTNQEPMCETTPYGSVAIRHGYKHPWVEKPFDVYKISFVKKYLLGLIRYKMTADIAIDKMSSHPEEFCLYWAIHNRRLTVLRLINFQQKEGRISFVEQKEGEEINPEKLILAENELTLLHYAIVEILKEDGKYLELINKKKENLAEKLSQYWEVDIKEISPSFLLTKKADLFQLFYNIHNLLTLRNHFLYFSSVPVNFLTFAISTSFILSIVSSVTSSMNNVDPLLYFSFVNFIVNPNSSNIVLYSSSFKRSYFPLPQLYILFKDKS